MAFRLIVHEVSNDDEESTELDSTTQNFDSLPDALRAMANAIEEHKGVSYDRAEIEGVDLSDENVIAVLYYLNNDSGEEWQYELGVA